MKSGILGSSEKVLSVGGGRGGKVPPVSGNLHAQGRPPLLGGALR